MLTHMLQGCLIVDGTGMHVCPGAQDGTELSISHLGCSAWCSKWDNLVVTENQFFVLRRKCDMENSVARMLAEGSFVCVCANIRYVTSSTQRIYRKSVNRSSRLGEPFPYA
jgi:hypothetical protein